MLIQRRLLALSGARRTRRPQSQQSARGALASTVSEAVPLQAQSQPATQLVRPFPKFARDTRYSSRAELHPIPLKFPSVATTPTASAQQATAAGWSPTFDSTAASAHGLPAASAPGSPMVLNSMTSIGKAPPHLHGSPTLPSSTPAGASGDEDEAEEHALGGGRGQLPLHYFDDPDYLVETWLPADAASNEALRTMLADRGSRLRPASVGEQAMARWRRTDGSWEWRPCEVKRYDEARMQ